MDVLLAILIMLIVAFWPVISDILMLPFLPLGGLILNAVDKKNRKEALLSEEEQKNQEKSRLKRKKRIVVVSIFMLVYFVGLMILIPFFPSDTFAQIAVAVLLPVFPAVGCCYLFRKASNEDPE